MKFTFTDKKLEISDELRQYAQKKVGKIDRLFRTESEAFTTFSWERGLYTVEVTLKNNGMFYRASETTGDMFASVDSACASIERQIRKNKTRLAKKLKNDPIDWDAHGVTTASTEEEAEEEFSIVRTKRFSIKPMTPQEAILQMNLLEHEFYAFLNSEEEEAFAVVYRRKNGGYGLISATDD